MQNVVRLACACALALIVGCTGEAMNEWNQGSARDVISRGGVPDPALITIEGMLASHELSMPSADCDALLCARPALAVAPNLATGQTEYWVHVAMVSGLVERRFTRPALDMVVVIDKSATMAVDMAETNEAVVKLITSLRADDRLAVLAFDSEVHELKALGPISNVVGLIAQVRGIRATGGWNLSRATANAYKLLSGAKHRERMRRVVVLSGANPAIDAEHSDPFSTLALQHGKDGIGLSFFGVLLGYDSRVADLLELSLGGAYRNVPDLGQVAHMFDADFDAMFTPLVYDMNISLNGLDGFEVSQIYGHASGTDVATMFLGTRGGTLVANLTPPSTRQPSRTVGRIDVSYVPEPSLGWRDAVSQRFDVQAPDGTEAEVYFETRGVRKAVALINHAQQMKAACAAFHSGDRVGAIATMTELHNYLAPEAVALSDSAMNAELMLLNKLTANMQ